MGQLVLDTLCSEADMEPIRVVVHGVLGKMGQQVLATLCGEGDMEPVGGADAFADDDTIALPDGSGTVPLFASVEDTFGDAQVVVDFSSADGATAVMRAAAPLKVNVVIGSTGIQPEAIEEAGILAEEHDVGIIIAPNFAVGAVLMIHLARETARFFDYADLTETHHEAKIDAPSGTAIAIANAALEGKGGEFLAPQPEKMLVPGTRGGTSGGVTIHSARMAGRVAHHELVFGALGQTLTIRHDSINRESFMPGVMMAIREAVKRPGLTVGLDKIMRL
jgi:4-hydroxy-tetrahydrodipicolinate reductase